MVDEYDPKTWTIVMDLDCSTEEETEIESSGDWEFILRKIGIE